MDATEKESEIRTGDRWLLGSGGAWWGFVAVLGALALSACGDSSTTTSAAQVEQSTSTPVEAVTSTAPISAPGRFVEVPASARPAIDGVLGSGEWDNAFQDTMSDGSSIYAILTGETLFAAVDTGGIGAVNLALATEEEIWILHSSAALGSARYVRGHPDWVLAHGFSWCCRSSTDDTERKVLLADEGWQANIGFEGDEGVVEFEVDLTWQGSALAVSFVTGTGTEAFWPADLSPAAQEQLVGARQSGIDFLLDEWLVFGAGG